MTSTEDREKFLQLKDTDGFQKAVKESDVKKIKELFKKNGIEWIDTSVT